MQGKLRKHGKAIFHDFQAPYVLEWNFTWVFNWLINSVSYRSTRLHLLFRTQTKRWSLSRSYQKLSKQYSVLFDFEMDISSTIRSLGHFFYSPVTESHQKNHTELRSHFTIGKILDLPEILSVWSLNSTHSVPSGAARGGRGWAKPTQIWFEPTQILSELPSDLV